MVPWWLKCLKYLYPYTKPNIPNQIFSIKHTKLNAPNKLYQTKSRETKSNKIQSNVQSQFELSLAQLSPSLFFFLIFGKSQDCTIYEFTDIFSRLPLCECFAFFPMFSFCQPQPQHNSTSTQTKAEVSLISTWSTHPPGTVDSTLH